MNYLPQQQILSVSELTASLKNLLETEFKFIRVSGEISNLKNHFSGHSYFTLKDSGAQLRAVLFKQQKRFVAGDLRDGQQVICFGRISVYEPRGDYQLIVNSVEALGAGLLQQQFELLKKKLEQKGYFSAGRKRPIPPFPEKIVIISSPTGAAIHDLLKIYRIRKSSTHLLLLPVKVQGKEAAGEISAAIKRAQAIPGAELIVLCRGGGSIEDLWAFNEEIVADAIVASGLPVVTGIGHETDFTIADFCADFRCPTPTGAAERLIVDEEVLRRHIQDLRCSLQSRINKRFGLLAMQLDYFIKRIGTLDGVLKNLEYRLQLSRTYFLQAMGENISIREKQLTAFAHALNRHQPLNRLELQEKQLQFLLHKLQSQIQRLIDNKANQLRTQAALLNGVSPLATLGRGYAITRKKDEKTGEWRVVRTSAGVFAGEAINILLGEGELDCTVINARP